ncbi:MAG TPA: ABC transporter substrate-binding protein [Stellaceae bacterium]|nr:ABC transporter substrate-binding protein [Stellaceae bacterium]
MDFATRELHAKKIAIVLSQTPYAQNAAKFMRAREKRLGVDVVYSQAIELSVTDMTPQMAALKAAGPDAVIDVLTGSTHIANRRRPRRSAACRGNSPASAFATSFTAMSFTAMTAPATPSGTTPPRRPR